MACKYKAPNGAKSEVYDQLYNKYGHKTAIKAFAQIQTKTFKEWYADGKVNENGEPILQNDTFINSKGQKEQVQIDTKDNPISLEHAASQIEELTALFEAQGLDIEVQLDSDIQDAGQVITVGGKTTVRFNPREIRKDTIFHEFGHILIDMLGNERVVAAGIENLKGSVLWAKIARLYPELDDNQLGKEVLTTAIGIEAARQYDERLKIRNRNQGSLLDRIGGWKAWFNNFLMMLADKLGIGDSEVRRLAYQLTGGKITYTLTGKPASYVQKQKANITIEQLAQRGKSIKLSADEKHYKTDDSPRLLTRVTTVIEKVKGVFNREATIQNLISSNKPEWARFHTAEQLGEYWADKREEGTGIHLIAETYILSRNKGINRADSIKAVLDNLHTPPNAGKLDAEGIRFYSGMDKQTVSEYVGNIADFIDSLYKKGYKLYPEVKIHDNEMGVAGTIDLVVVKPNGNLMIYDWKTKEKGKFDHFYKLEGNFLGLMSDVPKSKAAEYSLQLSTYKMMLERQGFKVDTLAIVPLIGEAITQNEETRYHNVRLAVVQGVNSDGVLPLQPLDQRLQDVYEVKLDVEKAVLQSTEMEDFKVSNVEKIKAMEHTKSWLKELLINLEKSVSRIRATGTREVAAKYEEAIDKLIKEINVADENMAIAAYTQYVQRNINGLYGRFGNKIEEVTAEDGSVSQNFVKGYSDYTWEMIQELEEKDPKKYMEFLAFMINAQIFIDQMLTIRELPQSVGAEMNVVIAALKQQEGLISDIQWKLDRLNKELDKRYYNISSNPLYGGRGILQGTEDFLKAQVDESYFQSTFDSLADTHNTYMANVQRAYDYMKRQMSDETAAKQEEWLNKVAELEATGSNLMRFVDVAKGKFVQEHDYDAYISSRNAMYVEANKYPKKSKERAKTINDWYAANHEILPQAERDAIQAKKKADLSAAEYKVWMDKSFIKVKKGYIWSKTSEMYRPKLENFTSERYASFTDAEKKFHKYMDDLMKYLVEHSHHSIIDSGYLPAVPTNMQTFMEQFLANIGYKGKGTYDAEKGLIVDENNEVVHFLPFMFNALLNQKPLIEIDANWSKEKIAETEVENKKIQAENRAAHASAVNTNIAETIPVFIKTALTNKYKAGMEYELTRVKHSFERNHRIKVEKNGLAVLDKVKLGKKGTDASVTKSTVGSNIAQRYDTWLRQIFYEDFELDEGALQKVVRVLQNYTSLKSMAFNPYSGINNQLYGEVMIGIESAAGEFFNKTDWKWASFEYGKGIPSYFAKTENEFKHASKQSAFMDFLPIVQDFKEVDWNENRSGSKANRAMQLSGKLISKAYMFEHMSEHNVQNRVLLAMAKSNKIVGDTIMDYQEFKRGKMKELSAALIETDKANAVDFVKENLKKEAEIQKEWATFTSLYDSYSLVEGKLKLNDGIVLKKNELAEFQRKTLGVNQYLHGIYNKEDAGVIQQYALGRAVIQFKKWMRPGWNKRFGARFGESNWNERRSRQEEGMYVTTFNFFTRPIKDNIKKWREDEKTTAMVALGNIAKDYLRFVQNIKLHWHTLTDSQKSNVIRTMGEYLAFCSMFGLVKVLENIKGDDDDPDTKLLLAIYQADRLATELSTYAPIGVIPGFYVGGGAMNETMKIIKSPAAILKTFTDILAVGGDLLTYPFGEDKDVYFKGGVYHGESRLAIHAGKMIPIWNQYIKFQYMNQNYKHFKLFD